jgi:hypothetical protein
MTIHFNADLRSVVGERVGMLHWIMDPLPSGFIIAYDLSGNQVLISNFDVRVEMIFICSTINVIVVKETSCRVLGREPLSKSSSRSDWKRYSIPGSKFQAMDTEPEGGK